MLLVQMTLPGEGSRSGVLRVTDRLSDGERAHLMGGTLTRVYNWSPAKA